MTETALEGGDLHRCARDEDRYLQAKLRWLAKHREEVRRWLA